MLLYLTSKAKIKMSMVFITLHCVITYIAKSAIAT